MPEIIRSIRHSQAIQRQVIYGQMGSYGMTHIDLNGGIIL